jgi:hypothetical protein
MFKCKICGEEFESSKGMTLHSVQKHNMNSKTYYDKFVKKPTEGFCKFCGEPTKYKNFTKGYCKTCESCSPASVKIECKLCGRLIGGSGIGQHLRNSHQIEGKTYYDTYIRKSGEGICPTCGKETHFTGIRTGYTPYCSDKCAANDEAQKRKREATNLKKFGVKCNLSAASNREKQYKTNLEKFGTKFPQQTSEVKEKIKQTNIEKYGQDNYAKTEECKKKINETCLKKSNGKYTWTGQFPESREKAVKTINEKTEEERQKSKDKAKNTNLAKFGEVMPLLNHDILMKARKRYLYNGINFDSSYELALFLYLQDNKIPFTYHPDIVFEYEHDGKMHKYMPDFLINEKIVEVKGPQFFKNEKMVNPYDASQNDFYEAKHQCMLANHVEIITNCDKYIDYINKKYGTDYISEFRK